MRTWVKLHTRILQSPDLDSLSDFHYRCCMKLFALGGFVDQHGQLGTLAVIAYHLRISQDDALACLKTLATIDIVIEKKGVWQLANWDKYQSNSPSSENGAVRERVKKHRENKPKQDDSNDVTPSLHSEGNDTRLEQNREDKSKETAAPKPAAVSSPVDPGPVNELSALFEQLSGVGLSDIPKRDHGVRWWNPLRQMVKIANGNAPELLRATMAQLRKGDISVGAPQSCLKTFTGLHGQHKLGNHAGPRLPDGV